MASLKTKPRVETHGMHFGRFYVVEASFRANNPVHRYIAHSARPDGTVELVMMDSSEDGAVFIDDLAFFKVVEEITSMRGKPSKFMPKDR